MAQENQPSEGRKSDSGSREAKPDAENLQGVDLGASKGADLQVSAAAPAAFASLTGYLKTGEGPMQRSVEEDAASETAHAPAPAQEIETSPITTALSGSVDQEALSAPAPNALDLASDVAPGEPAAPTSKSGVQDTALRAPAVSALPSDTIGQSASFPPAAPVGSVPIAAVVQGGDEDIREAEAFRSFSSQMLENSPDGAAVIVLPEVGQYGDQISYSFTDAAGNPVSPADLQLVGNEVQVAPGGVLDFEKAETQVLYVTATTPAGVSSPWPITLAVSDAAEALVLKDGGVGFTDTGVAENSITGCAGDDAITGHNAGAVLDGAGGADQLTGGTSGDVLTGGLGDDTLDGSAGSDVAVFSGNWSDYTITEAGGVYTVTDDRLDSPDGTDILINIEVLRFADGDRSAADALNDAPELTVADASVTENAAGARVTMLQSTDADAGDKATLTVDDARFEIVNGHLKLCDDVSLDYETDGPTVAVTVTATDNHGATDTQVVAITIEDTGEALVLDDGGAIFTDTGVTEASITGGSGNDTITGNTGGAVIDGAAGDDAVNGGTGADNLTGGTGDDMLDGGTGSDTAVWEGDLADFGVSYDSGTDTFTVVDGNSADGADEGTDTVTGIESYNFNSVIYTAADMQTEAARQANTGPGGAEVANGGTVDENSSAGTVVATLTATDIDGDALTYIITDADGNPVADSNFEIRGNEVRVRDGAGLDFESDASHQLYVTASDVVETSSPQGITITVNDVAEAIAFDDSGEIFTDAGVTETSVTGGAGDDSITGSKSADALTGGAGNDTITGEGGSDVISGGLSDDVIAGGSGSDTISGSEGGDDLDGGTDNDTLVGGAGNDMIDGGLGEADMAVLSGDLGDFSVSYSSDTETFSIVDGNTADGLDEGTDAVTGVEAFEFNGVTYSAAQMITEAARQANQAPTQVSFSSGGSVNETVTDGGTIAVVYDPSGATVATLTTSDADSEASHTYTLVNDASGKFEIVSDEVRVKAGQTVDYETDTSFDLTIRTTDEFGEIHDEVLTLNVTDFEESYTADDNGEAITGTSEEDTINGGAGADTIDGGAGDDVIAVGGSPDVDALVLLNFNDGGAVAQDTSGNDRGGAFKGDAVDGGTGWNGQGTGVLLDGEGDYVEISNDSAFELTAGTVSVRFNAGSLTGEQTIFSRDSKGFDGGGHITTSLRSDGSVEVRLQSTSNNVYLYSDPGSVTAGEWTHVAVSFGPDGAVLFLNGVEVDTNAHTGGLDGNSEPWTLGADQGVSGDGEADNLRDYFTGSIDEFAVFDSQLTAAEIAEIEALGVVVAPDELSGGDGNDQVTGGTDADIIYGGAGNDTLDGGDGNDSIDGDDGNDSMLGGNGADSLTAGAGDDVLFGEDGDDSLYGDEGSDTLDGGEGDDLLQGGAGDDVVFGEDGDDSLYGDEGSDTLNGGDGNDLLQGRSGNDIIDGGDGNDIALLSGTRADYTVTEAEGVYTVTDTRSGSPDGADSLTGIETLRFSDGDIGIADALNAAPTAMNIVANNALIDAAGTTETVVSGRILNADERSSIDHWEITHAGGDLVVDVYASGFNKSSLDSQMYLFREETDGSLTQVSTNDDGAAGQDGSTSSLDSYISESGLSAGTYILAIGSYPMTEADATSTASHPNAGAPDAKDEYQITFNGDATVSFATNPSSGGRWGDVGDDAKIHSTVSVDGDLSAGTVVASVTDVTDADAGDSHTFSLSDDAGGAFAIDADTGAISITGDPQAEGDYQDGITVVATDDQGASYAEDVSISFGSDVAETLAGATGNDIVYGFGGDDTITSYAGDDAVIAGSGDDVVSTGGGSDTIYGGTGSDWMSGGDGSDTFIGTALEGSDSIDGGSGWTDAIELAGFSGAVNVTRTTADGEGWTMALESGHFATAQTLDSLELTVDSLGVITFDDGGTIDFSGIERINF